MDASGRHQWPHWWTHRGRERERNKRRKGSIIRWFKEAQKADGCEGKVPSWHGCREVLTRSAGCIMGHFPIFSFGLLPPLFQNLSIRSLAKPLYSIITHHAPANPVSEAFLGESRHSANLKGQCLFKDQISIRPTNKKKEQQLRFSRKHDVGAWNRFTLPLIAAFKWKFSLYQKIQLIQVLQVFIISDFRWIRITVLFSNRFSMQMR